MAKNAGRPEFRQWIDRHNNPDWPVMPLTHVAKGITAEDIARSGKLEPAKCAVFGRPLSYLFYGRPAYRVNGDGAIKLAATCPFCFLFDPSIIEHAAEIHAFDTGAFDARLFKHALLDEMKVEDFSLEKDCVRINKLISAVFNTRDGYFDGVIEDDSIDIKSEKWEFLAQSYLSLLTSKGRNEPDDRIGSIEAIFETSISLKNNLRALLVPHVVWEGSGGAPWVAELATAGVDILPYHFVPGRHPDYYHALIEAEVRRYYREKGWL